LQEKHHRIINDKASAYEFSDHKKELEKEENNAKIIKTLIK
jgi:hypothetical protein